MRRRNRKTLQGKPALTPSPRINLPTAVRAREDLGPVRWLAWRTAKIPLQPIAKAGTDVGTVRDPACS